MNTDKKRMGLASLTLAALALLVTAGIPADVWTVDYRVKGEQFAIRAARHSTPAWTFTVTEAGAAADLNGLTPVLSWTVDGTPLGAVTGTVSGATVTLQVPGTNVLGQALSQARASLTATGAGKQVTLAVGRLDVVVAPEIERSAK